MRKQKSPNFDDRPAGLPIDMLVFHYTGMESAADAMARLCDVGSQVSAHYIVDEAGNLCQLVEEDKRAWHAGVASWRGETNINARSIGIELVNPGHEFGYTEFPEAQMESVIALAKGILDRHPIPPRNVVGHSDVAPLRKSDPGEKFDWQRLAALGIGLWPEEADHLEQSEAALGEALAAIGYELTSFPSTLKAFQRHFRPQRVTGRVDPETARRIIGLKEMLAVA